MSFTNADRIAAGARVKQPNLAVAAGGSQQRAPRVEREALDGVRVAAKDRLGALGAREVPELDDVVAGGGREDVVCRRMEENVADTARGHVDAGDGVKVLRLPAVLAPAVEGAGLDLPDHGLAVLAGGGDDRVVEGRPVRVENGASVAAGEGHEVG